MLTKAEALRYVHEVLQIQTVSLDTRNDRLRTLNEIILKQHEIPFQSLSLLQIQPEKRHRPTLAEIKESAFTKIGGLCYTLNVFFFFLLKALGYDTYLNISSVADGKRNDHILVLVANVLEEGDLYLVEVGSSYPTFQAISLDFTDESPTFRETNIEYKFVKEDKLIKRLHALDNKTQASKMNDFRLFYEFELNPSADVQTFDGYFDYVYEDVDAVIFHKLFVAKKITQTETTSIVNYKLTIKREKKSIEKVDLDDEDKVVSAAKDYFPQFDEDMVRKALDSWKSTQDGSN